MDTRYSVIRKDSSSWTVDHDGDVGGEYASKEAAFEAIVAAASNSIRDGLGVTITVPSPAAGENVLGTKDNA
ncbi:MAG TPA: hypothetical protein VNR39_13740 [Pseudolabrys sp.]|nr:hypothetical protein [Pseudolabrys sp.]